MLNKRQTTGRVLSVSKIRRRQVRKPRKLLEATPQDWAKWERFAKLEGLNWSEFARRALEQRCSSVAELEQFAIEKQRDPSVELRAALQERLPGFRSGAQLANGNSERLSEKPRQKNGAAARAKNGSAVRRGKGSSRS